jgi:hypothetical protein
LTALQDLSEAIESVVRTTVREDPSRDFLIVGRPGVDGIEWGYRRGYVGTWAHYPVARDFRLLADSISALRDGYTSGRVKV